MKVAGVDPGLSACGYVLLDLDRRDVDALLDHALVKTKPSHGTEAERRAIVLAALKPIIRSVDLVAIETQYLGGEGPARGRIASNVAQVRSVATAIEDYCGERGVPVAWVAPASAKLALAGHGKAVKEQMVAAARGRFGAVLSEHEADAVGIALAGAGQQRTRDCNASGAHPSAGGRAKPTSGAKVQPDAIERKRGASGKRATRAQAVEDLPAAVQRAAKRAERGKR